MDIAKYDNCMASLTDVELCSLLRQGTESAFDELAVRYISLIKMKAATYYSSGIEQDDLLQEGSLGLLSAAKRYQNFRGASFKTYVSICVERRLLSAYKSTVRQKHMPLNYFVSLSEYSDSFGAIYNFSLGGTEDPETFVIGREDLEFKRRSIEKSLSGFERKVFSLYLEGRSYDEISEKLYISTKSVDNALQRTRKKLRNIFE